MKWKIDTFKRNGVHYVTGFHFTVNREGTMGLLECPEPPDLEILDGNGKRQLMVDLDGTITKQTQVLTDAELENRRRQYIVERIREKYTIDQEFALLRRQLVGEENTGWSEYIAYVRQITTSSGSAIE